MAAIYECYSTTTPSYTQGSGDTEVKGNGILSRSLSNGSQAVQNSYASDPGTNDTSQGVGTLDENSDLGFSYIYGGETPQLAWRTDSGNVSLNYQESTLYELNSNSTGGVNYRDSLRNVSSADALELMKADLEKDYSDYYDELIRTGVSGYWYTLGEDGTEQKVLWAEVSGGDADEGTDTGTAAGDGNEGDPADSTGDAGNTDNAEITVTFAPENFSPAEGAVYYLKWNTDAETVVFHYMDGSGEDGLEGETTREIEVGKNSTYTFFTPYREGYQFLGWYLPETAEDAEEEITSYYGEKTESYTAVDENDSGIEVYAKWQTADISWYTEAGADAEEYVLTDAEDIIGLAQITAGLTLGDGSLLQDSFDGKKIRLADDASGSGEDDSGDTSGDDTEAAAEIDLSEKEWILPVGTEEHPFSGSFDGQGGRIDGLTIDTEETYQAFFGFLQDADISDVTVSGNVVSSEDCAAILAASVSGNTCVIGVTTEGSLQADSYAGGMIAELDGEGTVLLADVKNIAVISGTSYLGGVIGRTATGSDISITLEGAENEGNVTTTSYYAGGIIGYANYGSISFRDCKNSGDISSSRYAGGIGGTCTKLAPGVHSGNENSGTVQSSGTYAGGLFSQLTFLENNTEENAATVLCDSGNTGSVSGGNYTAGLIGNLTTSTVYEGFCRLYNAGTITGSGNYVGGIVGNISTAVTFTDCYNTGDVSAATRAGGIVHSGATAAGRVKLKNCFNSGDIQGSTAANTGVLLCSSNRNYIGDTDLENCYYLDGCITAFTDLTSVKDINNIQACGESDFSEGILAWNLNTGSGTTANTGVFSQGEETPVFADETHGAVFRMAVTKPEGSVLTASAELSGQDTFCFYRENSEESGYLYTAEGAEVTFEASAGETGNKNLANLVVRDSAGDVLASVSTTNFTEEGLKLTLLLGSDGAGIVLTAYESGSSGSTVTVTFDGNGGYFGEDTEKTTVEMTVDYGSTFGSVLERMTETVRRGEAESDGWYLDAAATQPVDENGFITGDVTLYAGFPDFCQVTFDVSNYGGERTEDWPWPYIATVIAGEPVASVEAPSWSSTTNNNGSVTSHEFLGWFTESSGGEEWDFSQPVSSSMTLYAQWSTTTSSVTYDEPVTEIASEADLRRFSWTLQSGVTYEGQTVTMTEDIEMSTGFTLGDSIDTFKGTFDGGGHTLTVRDFNVSGSADERALFQRNQGVIQNLKMEVEPGLQVALCYWNDGGTISGCAVEGSGNVVLTCRSGLVENCVLSGGDSVDAANVETLYDQAIGGIVSSAGDGTVIRNCTVEEDVTIRGWLYAGGIVGIVNPTSAGDAVTIENCVNHADIVESDATAGHIVFGGIVGGVFTQTPAVIKNCYNTGTVDAGDDTSINSGASYSAGGIAAIAEGASTSISSCYNTGTVKGARSQGGIVGSASDITIENCYSTGDMEDGEQVTLYAGGIAGSAEGSSTIRNCYWFGDTFDRNRSNTEYRGGLIAGYADEETLTAENCYYGFVDDQETMVSSDSYVGNSGSGEEEGETVSAERTRHRQHGHGGRCSASECWIWQKEPVWIVHRDETGGLYRGHSGGVMDPKKRKKIKSSPCWPVANRGCRLGLLLTRSHIPHRTA